jgi:beta-galactosidase
MHHRFLTKLAAFAILFSSGCASISSNGKVAPVSPRMSIDLNSDWRFIRQDAAGAQATSFDDSSWQAVQLPHTWNNLDGQDGGNDYYRGPGWYRRKFTVGPDLIKRSLFLKFDAASLVADVYVNGQRAGGHKGAFAAFVCDVTQLLHPGPDNVIAVRVDNARDPDVPPLEGDFTIFGGLYRPVHLLALDSLSITPLDDGGPGVYATQASVTPALARLHVTTKLRNAGAGDKSASVLCQILDPNGKVVLSATTRQNVPANGNADAAQDISLQSPHLWNGRKDPYLYTLRVTVSDGAAVVDALDQPLGLRFFSIDPDKGFSLNGQTYALHGVNRHQDRIDMGWAIGMAQQREDFNLIMEMGCTGIRLAHYQHAQDFYDLCDAGGLVVWAEACMVNHVTISDAFDAAALQQVRELVKQNYNHPSICFWSLFNELRSAHPQADPQTDPEVRHQIELVTKLNDLAHELDRTRLTTAASNLLDSNYPRNTITDIIGYNGYAGWYNGAPGAWPGLLDALRTARPARAVGISEYGAGASAFQHQVAATQPRANLNPWHPEEWQTTVHEAAYAAMKQRPWLWGTYLWCMFDFASDGRNEGDHAGRNDKGMVTYDRKTKKDTFYFYKANWSEDPFVYISDRRFTPRNVAAGAIKIYSNCDSVELFLNGQSLGSRSADDIHRFVWDEVTLKTGDNQLRAVGKSTRATHEDSCTIIFDTAAPDRVNTAP